MASACWRQALTAITLLTALYACAPQAPVFHASGSPVRLSEWNLFVLSADSLAPAPAAMVFAPTNQLFTDYAQKLRTLWLPPATAANWLDGEIDYPVGTILTKTFYYPVDGEGTALQTAPQSQSLIDLRSNQLVETRLLVRREQGWDAFPYVWNDEETEAFLRVAGSSKLIDLKNDAGSRRFSYFVPNENQCAACHVTEHPDGELQPLAAIARQLGSSFDADADPALTQIEELQQRGWLSAAANSTPASTLDSTPDSKPDAVSSSPAISWLDPSATTAERASAYLNVHCGHCHNPQGAADTSALLLDGSNTAPINLGVCKPPVAAGGGAGERLFAIVPGAPERSILLYRMESSEPDEMMPELGRTLVHAEGVALISQWIAELPGSCPTDGTAQ